MSGLCAEQLVSATGGRWLGTPPADIQGVGIDSRQPLQGMLFAAIAGPRHDGHHHLEEAFGNGAVAAVVEQEMPDASGPCLLVDDVRGALQRAAVHHRATLRETVVIAITGSAGKTTTRRMLETVLAQQGPGSASVKSFNNDLGVPLTLLNAKTDDQWLLVEVGTNAPGEIHQLGQLVDPDIALITGIGSAHLEGLGDIHAVAKEKASLLGTLRAGGRGLINTDRPEILPEVAGYAVPQTTYGARDGVDLQLTSRRAQRGSQDIEVNGRFRARVALPGVHNAINALGVYGVGRMLEMEEEAIAQGLARVEPAPMRMERVELGDMVVWNDAYNANPDSMAAALDTFIEQEHGSGRLVAVLGAMLELGDQSDQFHDEVGRTLAGLPIDHLIGIGSHGQRMVEAARSAGFAGCLDVVADVEEKDGVAALCRPGDRVLLKGSRGVGLERVLVSLAHAREVPQ